MKYKVIRDNHCINRYWNENEVVEFPDGFVPNEHFKVFDENDVPKNVVEVPEEAITMSAMNEARKRNDDAPKTGMAHVPKEDSAPSRGKPGPKPKQK